MTIGDEERIRRGWPLRITLCICSLLILYPPDLHAQGYDSDVVSFHGFLRQRVSMNLDDPPEVEGDNQFGISMLRGTAYGELNLFAADWLSFTFIGRADGELASNYVNTLEDASGVDMQDFYSDGALREAYADLRLGDRVKLRLGKQQVVWGKTDFFRGTDLMHGFDFRWRSFLEPENELLRKPLTMANAQIQVPEVNGALQLVFRPGLDPDDQMGHTYDLRGGRWANQPNKGFDFLTPNEAIEFPGVPFNYEHPDADPDDPGYGARWSGRAGGFEYSLSYLKTLNLDPVVNSVFNPYVQAPSNEFAEFIHPEIDMVGGTLNYYLAPLDIVMRTEAAYTIDQPYNVGTNFLDGALPGFNGIKEKDTMQLMFGFDRIFSWVEDVFGASRPGFFTAQVFDQWLVDFDEADDLVALAGYGAPIKRHNAIVTGILSWNYRNDRINPTLAAGASVSNGGGFLIPSIEFVLRNHWRFKLEGDVFFDDGSKLPGEVEMGTTLFGYFANNDQLYARLTYQF